MIEKLVELFRQFLISLFGEEPEIEIPKEEIDESILEEITETPIEENTEVEPIEEPIPEPIVEETITETKSIDELAQEVLDGKWGSGKTRKANLTEAGYDYEAVQEKVNEIIAEREAKQKAEEEEAARIAAEEAAARLKAEYEALIDKLAHEVLDGKWGSGDKRKENLEAAGYNYYDVQARVNEILETKVTSKYPGTLPTLKLVKSNAEVINDACRWATWIAGDNRFHYGYTNKHGSSDTKKWNPNAHHNGCYFCGTNTTSGGRSKKGITDYQRTYCCNPFVHAAWAHGGCIPKALSICRDGSSWDYHKGKGYDSSSLFTNLGKPAKSKLKKGDVCCNDSHIFLYIGNGKVAEAASGDDNVRNSTKWNNSIHITNLSDSKYKGVKRVHRYNSSVNTEALIRHGEISNRIAQWQAFLDWLYDGQVGSADGIYGDNTLNWTKKFQEEYIGAGQGDGIIGNKTLEAAANVEK